MLKEIPLIRPDTPLLDGILAPADVRELVWLMDEG